MEGSWMTIAAMPASGRPAANRRVPSAWISRRPEISPERLPVEVDLSPWRLGAAILCAAGLLLLWSMREFLDEMFRAEEPLLVAITAVFPLIGVGLIVAGLVQMYRRQHVRFGETGVEVSERNVTGSRRWSAAYSDYAGVLQREHTVRNKNSSTTYQIIQLSHADPAYDLPLHVVRGDAPPRHLWEAWAARLALPALQIDDDRITARPAETLNHSLAQQLRAGHVTAGIGIGPPPKSLRIGEDGAGLRIDLKQTRLPLAWYAVLALFPAVFMVVGVMDLEAWPGMLVGLVFLGIFGWLAWKDFTSPRTIRLTRDTVENLDEWRWHSGDVETLNAADIEIVRIYQSGRGGRAVAVESDHGTMHLGHGLSREDLTWLRDYLIAEIARRARRDF
jgi:hypothetical protein